MPALERASNVCHACTRRKKACDKALPACSFCASRQLICRYDVVAQKPKPPRAHYPGRNFVAIHTTSPPSDSAKPNFRTERTSLEARSGHTQSDWNVSWLATRPIIETVGQQVRDIIEAVNPLSEDEISKRFFERQWLPILSPRFLHQAMSDCSSDGSSPSVDFTVLRYAMWLMITCPKLDEIGRPSPLDREALYMALKSFFAQAQTAIRSSVILVQTALLVATYEYTIARPEAAYISMGTCTSMARVLGIGVEPIRKPGSEEDDLGPRLTAIEWENLGWATAMLDRIIIAEVDHSDLQPHSDIPNINTQLPTPDACGVTHFEQKGEEIRLLEEVLRTTRPSLDIGPSTLSQLSELDTRIRSFLAVAMGEDSRKPRSKSGPIAFAMRSVFLLHRAIRDALQNPQTEAEHQARQFSQAALDTACEMVLELARNHKYERVPMKTKCCYYNVQAAIEHLQGYPRSEWTDRSADDLDTITRFKDEYCRRWVF